MKTNSFTKKLKSNTGASMLLALAFFLMCFFVASVVMASASVNASRALAQKEEQRSYFAIQSAEDLIKGMFKEINGEDRSANMQKIDLQPALNPDGTEVFDDAGNAVSVQATTYGGYHLREEVITYSCGKEPREFTVLGKKQSVGGTIALLDVLPDPGSVDNGLPEDIDYSKDEFGLDCIGNKNNVVFKDAIEEVTSLVLCKRLFNQGEKSMPDDSGLKDYFDIASSNMDNGKPFSLVDNPDYTYYFDIKPLEEAGKHAQNIPTVHVKMTADNYANLYFELTVDSRFASTYSAIVKAKATIDTTTPNNSLLRYPVIGPDRCPSLSDATKVVTHRVTKNVSDTYVAWYTKDIEVKKGVSSKTESSS